MAETSETALLGGRPAASRTGELHPDDISRTLASPAVQAYFRREADLLADEPGYFTYGDIMKGVSDHLLAPVPTENEGIRPIARFINPARSDETARMYPLYLTPTALDIYNELGERWQEAIHAMNGEIDHPVRLAGTSFVRSENYQQRLVSSGNFANPNVSAHITGNAFDLDACGIYQQNGDGAWVGMNPRGPKEQAAYRRAFAQMGTPNGISPVFGQNYNSGLVRGAIGSLDTVLGQMAGEGKLIYLVEMPGTQSETRHICVNPQSGKRK